MADFSSNFNNSMTGYLKLDTEGGGGGGGKNKEVAAPSGYTPSTPDQRKSWNKFLDFLSEKGIAGSTTLDRRDQTIGLGYLEEFNKSNPKNKIDPSFIPVAQYESHLIRKKNEFPGLTAEESKYAFSGLSPQYKDRPISDVDSWLGSYTSKQYYPTYHRGVSKNIDGRNVTEGKYDFDVNFEDYTRSLSNSEIQEKYRVK